MSQEIDPALAAQRIAERTGAYEVRKSGADDPNDVSLAIKMRVLLRHLGAYLDDLAPKISKDAMTLLVTAAATELTDSRTDNSSSNAIWHDICSNIDSLDAPDIARKLMEVSEKFGAKREARYWISLHQLADIDLQIVLDFLDTEVAPTVNLVDADAVGLATELPREYKQVIRISCQERLSGYGQLSEGSAEKEVEIGGASGVQLGETSDF